MANQIGFDPLRVAAGRVVWRGGMAALSAPATVAERIPGLRDPSQSADGRVPDVHDFDGLLQHLVRNCGDRWSDATIQALRDAEPKARVKARSIVFRHNRRESMAAGSWVRASGDLFASSKGADGFAFSAVEVASAVRFCDAQGSGVRVSFQTRKSDAPIVVAADTAEGPILFAIMPWDLRLSRL